MGRPISSGTPSGPGGPDTNGSLEPAEMSTPIRIPTAARPASPIACLPGRDRTGRLLRCFDPLTGRALRDFVATVREFVYLAARSARTRFAFVIRSPHPRPAPPVEAGRPFRSRCERRSNRQPVGVRQTRLRLAQTETNGRGGCRIGGRTPRASRRNRLALRNVRVTANTPRASEPRANSILKGGGVRFPRGCSGPQWLVTETQTPGVPLGGA